METKRISILVVDDESGSESLKEALELRGYWVEVVTTGEVAVELVKADPKRFDFALIDQVLSDDKIVLDGIRTAKKILEINKDIGTIIFSGKREDKKKALSEGVHRYIYEKGAYSLPAIESYIQEIRILLTLKNKLVDLSEKRQALGSLMADLHVGIALIDREYRVWYADDRFAEIMGYSKIEPGPCYERFHTYKYDICINCPVQKAVELKKRHTSYFINPFYHGRLKYILSEAEPVFSDDKSDDKKEIIASIKSVLDIEQGQILADMDLNKHINLILKSVFERGKNQRRGYGNVKLCQLLDNGEVKNFRTTHQVIGDKNEGRIVIHPEETIEFSNPNLQAILSTKSKALRKQDLNGFSTAPALDFFLGDSTDFLGMLIVEQRPSGYPLDNADREIIGEYANLLAQVLTQVDHRQEIVGTLAIKPHPLNELRLNLSKLGDPEDALKIILQTSVDFTKANMGHIRKVEDDNKCGMVVYQGHYGELAPKIIHAYLPYSATARTIESQRLFIARQDDFTLDPHILYSITDPLIQSIKSLLILPIVLEGKCIGFMKLMSFQPDIFNEKTLNPFLISLNSLCAYALREYCIIQKDRHLHGELEKEKALREWAMWTVHNIRNPADILGKCVGLIKDSLLGKLEISPGKVLEYCSEEEHQLNRIFKLTHQIGKALVPIQSKIKVNITNYLQLSVISLRKTYQDVSFEFSSDIIESIVLLDPNSFMDVMQELTTNATKMAAEGQKLEIKITLKNPDVNNLKGYHMVNHNFILMNFQDNGPGIPSHIKDNIFEPWKTTISQSLGLGLYNVRRIIKEHGWEIYLVENDEPGTNFEIIMPVIRED